MDEGKTKKGKLMGLKDEIDALSKGELKEFVFEFVKEPKAYVMGRFSDSISLKESDKIAKAYSDDKATEKELMTMIDELIHLSSTIEDPYDREVLYSISSAYLSLNDRCHAFDAILHDIESISIDEGLEKSLQLIPLRIDHFDQMIRKIKEKTNSSYDINKANSSYYSNFRVG